MKSGNLNFLEPSGPLQACNGTDLTFYLLNNSCIFSGRPALIKDLLHIDMFTKETRTLDRTCAEVRTLDISCGLWF